MEPTTDDDHNNFDRGRRRKVSSNSRFGDEFFVDDSDMRKASAKWQQEKKIKKKKPSIVQVASDPNVEVIKPQFFQKRKSKPAPAKPLTTKQKEENERENWLLQDYQERLRQFSSNIIRTLREGPFEVSDYLAAIKIGVNDSNTLPLDWTNPSIRRIGQGCKVYWDGDGQWYYARIMLYDCSVDRYLIHYDVDSTSEWIDFKAECVYVSQGLAYAKNKSSCYPVIYFWASERAKVYHSELKHFKEGGIYSEYLNDKREYAYLHPSQLFPFEPSHAPSKQSRYLEIMTAAAFRESEVVNAVIQDVIDETRKIALTKLQGEDWIGMRVRAHTNPISNQLEQSSQVATKHVATVVNYCPSIDEHFILFDDPTLQPQWIKCNTADIDLLIGPSIRSCDATVKFMEQRNFNVFSVDSVNGLKCFMCGENEIVSERLATSSFVQVQACTDSSPNCHAIHPVKATDFGSALTSSTASSSSKRGIRSKFKSAIAVGAQWCGGRRAIKSFKSCTKCKKSYHSYCLPVSKFPYFQQPGEEPIADTCWNCISCLGCCGKTLWDMPMLSWSLQRVHQNASADKKPVCGGCLKQYKEDKQFCPICYKIYFPEPQVVYEEQLGDCNRKDDIIANIFPTQIIQYLPESSNVQLMSTLNLPNADFGTDYAALDAETCSDAMKKETKSKPSKGSKRQRPTNSSTYNKDSVESLNDVCEQDGNIQVCEETNIPFTVCPTDTLIDSPLAYFGVESQANLLKPNAADSISCTQIYINNDKSSPIRYENESATPVLVEKLSSLNDTEVATKGPHGGHAAHRVSTEIISPIKKSLLHDTLDERMVNCNQCNRWVHAFCEGLDEAQYNAIGAGTHPVWGDEYLCPDCRINISTEIVDKLNYLDQMGLGIFANPVTEDVAKNYFDIIRNPMDLQTMLANASRGHYKSVQTLRGHWEMMCLNALIFNKPGDEYWREAKRFYDQGLVIFDQLSRKSHVSAFGIELKSIVDKYYEANPIQVKPSKKAKKTQKYLLDSEPITETQAIPNSEESTESNTAVITTCDNVSQSTQDNSESSNTVEEADVTIQLPTFLANPPEPVSFIPYIAHLVPMEGAYFSCNQEQCFVCASTNSTEFMLTCYDCGEVYHSFCVEAPIATMTSTARQYWRCSNCKICECCGSASDSDSSNLVYCERCDRSFHIGCVEPPMTEVPATSWICSGCVSCSICKGYDKPWEDSMRQADDVTNLPTALNALEKAQTTYKFSPAWGCTTDKCQRCVAQQQDHNARVRAEVESKEKEDYENLLKYLEMAQLRSCFRCKRDCSKQYISCAQCTNSFHISCQPELLTSHFVHITCEDFRCDSCLDELRKSNNFNSHIGSDPAWMEILSMISLIQRKRLVAKQQALTSNCDNLRRRWCEQVQEIHLLSLKIVVSWGVSTYHEMYHLLGPKFEIYRANIVPEWIQARAARFVTLYRSYGLGFPEKHCIRMKSNFAQCRNPTGDSWSTETILRIASMSFAYLTVAGKSSFISKFVTAFTDKRDLPTNDAFNFALDMFLPVSTPQELRSRDNWFAANMKKYDFLEKPLGQTWMVAVNNLRKLSDRESYIMNTSNLTHNSSIATATAAIMPPRSLPAESSCARTSSESSITAEVTSQNPQASTQWQNLLSIKINAERQFILLCLDYLVREMLSACPFMRDRTVKMPSSVFPSTTSVSSPMNSSIFPSANWTTSQQAYSSSPATTKFSRKLLYVIPRFKLKQINFDENDSNDLNLRAQRDNIGIGDDISFCSDVSYRFPADKSTYQKRFDLYVSLRLLPTTTLPNSTALGDYYENKICYQRCYLPSANGDDPHVDLKQWSKQMNILTNSGIRVIRDAVHKAQNEVVKMEIADEINERAACDNSKMHEGCSVISYCHGANNNTNTLIISNSECYQHVNLSDRSIFAESVSRDIVEFSNARTSSDFNVETAISLGSVNISNSSESLLDSESPLEHSDVYHASFNVNSKVSQTPEIHPQSVLLPAEVDTLVVSILETKTDQIELDESSATSLDASSSAGAHKGSPEPATKYPILNNSVPLRPIFDLTDVAAPSSDAKRVNNDEFAISNFVPEAHDAEVAKELTDTEKVGRLLIDDTGETTKNKAATALHPKDVKSTASEGALSWIGSTVRIKYGARESKPGVIGVVTSMTPGWMHIMTDQGLLARRMISLEKIDPVSANTSDNNDLLVGSNGSLDSSPKRSLSHIAEGLSQQYSQILGTIGNGVENAASALTTAMSTANNINNVDTVNITPRKVRDVEDDESDQSAQPSLAIEGACDISSPFLSDYRRCLLCHVSYRSHPYDEQILGRLIGTSEGSFIHVNCLRFSHGVVEKQGTLEGAHTVIHSAVKRSCSYCKVRGASIHCMYGNCSKMYHLKCAMAVNFTFFEARKDKDHGSSAYDIHTLCCCPEHYPRQAALRIKAPRYRWIPHDPLRLIVTEFPADSQLSHTFLAEQLILKQGDIAVKCGALTILNVGMPSVDSYYFHTKDYIFPEHFKSIRIFWSMTKFMERTTYMFDVTSQVELEKHDFDVSSIPTTLDSSFSDDDILTAFSFSSQIFQVQQLSLSSSNQNIEYVDCSKNRPIFRLFVADDPDRVILARSVEDIYNIVSRAVERLKAESQPLLCKRKTKTCFGLHAYHFFGLGHNFVRRAIESKVEAISAMTPPPPIVPYKPKYVLPTQKSLAFLRNTLNASRGTVKVSKNGSCRADEFIPELADRRPGITRILVKATGANEDLNDGIDATSDVNPDELEETIRTVERNQYEYKELSEAYLANPFSRLAVRRSHIHGWGLYAKIHFAKDEMIVEYIGEKTRQIVADLREAQYEQEGVGSCYLFRLDKDYIVDATRRGGMARFINHCCEPNAYARVITTQYDEKHIIIFAARSIQEGEEITYDYKFPIEDKKLRCYCGAPKCSGSMN